MLKETQVRQELFSALSVSVTSVIVKSIKNLNPAPGRHDAPDGEEKERHWEIRQKLMCSHGLTFTLTAMQS